MNNSNFNVVCVTDFCTKVTVACVVVVDAIEEIEEAFREPENFEDDDNEGMADRWAGRTQIPK